MPETCALIPVFNHEHAIAAVVAAVRNHKLPCILVDDGSGSACARVRFVRGLSRTLGDLDKLAKLDEELLQKYSKVYFLNENYIPERLRQIDNKYILEGKGDQYFHARAIGQLEDMIDDIRDVLTPVQCAKFILFI